MCERACGSVFRVIFHAENLIKKINLWTFDSRRDKNRDGQQHLPLSLSHSFSLPLLLWLSLLRVLKLHADFDRWHSRCCRLLLPQLGNDNFNWNGACNVRAYVCVCVLSRPWPNTRTEKDSAGQSVARRVCHVCRMSCKLAQLIYFNTNLTLISCVLQCAAPQQFPRRLSAIYIVKILSLPYLNMAISYKDLPCVAVLQAPQLDSYLKVAHLRCELTNYISIIDYILPFVCAVFSPLGPTGCSVALWLPLLMLRHSFLHSPLVRGCSQR